jgi:hypothetical protein
VNENKPTSRTPESMQIEEQGIVDIVLDDEDAIVRRPSGDLEQRSVSNGASLTYIVLPVIYLLVTLLGGFRLGSADNSFIFVRPPLVCMVFAAVLMVLYIRAGFIRIDGWFSHAYSGLQSTADALVLLTVFTASVQLFNSVLPEQGLPFWVVGFCFFWTLWNDLFAEFDARKLIRSLAALFGLAFVTKYLLLANSTAPAGDNWLQSIFQNPTKEAFTWLLDLPRFAAGTGYVQFFVVAFYLLGLFLTPRTTSE